MYFFFFSSRRRHTILVSDWSSDVCSSDLRLAARRLGAHPDFLRRAHLRSLGLFLGGPGTGGGVHGHAGLSVRDHGGKAHALAVLPRVQPPFQRDPAAARRAAVATRAAVE